MKILLATIFQLPNTGGLWTYVEQMKNSLEKDGHTVDILAKFSDSTNFYLFNGVKKRHFSSKVLNRRLKPLINNALKGINTKINPEMKRLEILRYLYGEAAKKFGLETYDLIHAQDVISVQALARIKPPFTPLILTVHGCFTKEMKIAGMIKREGSPLWNYSALLEYIGVKCSDYTIFPSEYMKDTYINEFYIPDKNLKVIPNGMNIEDFLNEMEKPSQSFSPIPYGKKVIACVARLRKIKGHQYLFEALKKLKEERTDWVCWLIGDGGLKSRLLNSIEKLGLGEYVVFLGNRSDVPSLLNLVDICVLPSVQENCPYSIMEAQAAGKCVVASRVGGIPEMIQHGQTGYLFNPKDSQGLYEYLNMLLEDKQLRKSIAGLTMEWGHVHWSKDRLLSQTLKIYKACMKIKHNYHDKTHLDVFQNSNPNKPLHPILQSLDFSMEITADFQTSVFPNPFFIKIIKGLTNGRLEGGKNPK